MLQRVLETELMDTADEVREYDAMDHREVNCQFVEDLLAVCPEPKDVLDVGTGTAQIPVELCRRVATCRVMAADMARAMLEQARYQIEIAGLIGRIQLDRSDAKRMLYKDGMFDVVMCNGTLHHFADPRIVLAESLACDGGRRLALLPRLAAASGSRNTRPTGRAPTQRKPTNFNNRCSASHCMRR